MAHRSPNVGDLSEKYTKLQTISATPSPNVVKKLPFTPNTARSPPPTTSFSTKVQNLVIAIILRVLRIATAPIRYSFRAFLFVAKFFSSIVRDVCAQFLQPFNSLARYVGSFLVKAIKVLVILSIYTTIALGVAVSIYLLSYWAFIPSVQAERPLYFDYRNPSGLPEAYVQIAGDKDGFVPSNRFEYEVSIELVLPESVENLNAGMFMVTTSLFGDNGIQLFSSSRPCLLHYKSQLLRTMYTLFFGLPMILGFMEETQTLAFLPIDGWQNAGRESLSYATVTLSKPDIQIYNARVAIRARLTGFSYYAYHWSITTFFVGVGIIFSMETFFAIAIAVFILLRPPTEHSIEEAYYSASKKTFSKKSSKRPTFVPIYQPAVPAEHRHSALGSPEQDRFQPEEGAGASKGLWDMDKLKKVSEKKALRKRLAEGIREEPGHSPSASINNNSNSTTTPSYSTNNKASFDMVADDEINTLPVTAAKTVSSRPPRAGAKKHNNSNDNTEKKKQLGAGVGLSSSSDDDNDNDDVEFDTTSTTTTTTTPKTATAVGGLEEGWETVPDNEDDEQQRVVLTEPIIAAISVDVDADDDDDTGTDEDDDGSPLAPPHLKKTD
eukprot:TRINITY_DN3341_c2_g1_i3.p1 TRINITY_DN3341_c2_g1~~TRINITY_DN3341_c2_g1_i3.p1  ORF type:complete len:608 (+),score=142.61 TRINITY_DN3341_c2_g1_i3:113-1936(+)